MYGSAVFPLPLKIMWWFRRNRSIILGSSNDFMRINVKALDSLINREKRSMFQIDVLKSTFFDLKLRFFNVSHILGKVTHKNIGAIFLVTAASIF